MPKLKKRDKKEVAVLDKELAEIDRKLSAIYGVKPVQYKDLDKDIRILKDDVDIKKNIVKKPKKDIKKLKVKKGRIDRPYLKKNKEKGIKELIDRKGVQVKKKQVEIKKSKKPLLKKDLRKKKTNLILKDDSTFDIRRERLLEDLKKTELKKKQEFEPRKKILISTKAPVKAKSDLLPKKSTSNREDEEFGLKRFEKKIDLDMGAEIGKKKFDKRLDLAKDAEPRKNISIPLGEAIKPKIDLSSKKSISKKEDEEFVESLRKRVSEREIIKEGEKDKKIVVGKPELKKKPEKIKKDLLKDKVAQKKGKRFHFPKLGKLAHKKDKVAAGLLAEDKAKNLNGGAKKDFDYPRLENNKTFFDLLIDDIDKNGSMNLSEISEKYNVNKKIAQEWGEILKEHGLVDFFVPTFGEPQLRRKGLVVKKGEKGEKLPKKKINKKKLLIYSGVGLVIIVAAIIILVIQMGGLKEEGITTVGQDEMGEGEPFVPEASVQTAFSGSGSYDCRDINGEFRYLIKNSNIKIESLVDQSKVVVKNNKTYTYNFKSTEWIESEIREGLAVPGSGNYPKVGLNCKEADVEDSEFDT